jgi:hypothetical protein
MTKKFVNHIRATFYSARCLDVYLLSYTGPSLAYVHKYKLHFIYFIHPAVFLQYTSEVTVKWSGFRCYILNFVKHALTSDSGITVQIFHDIV